MSTQRSEPAIEIKTDDQGGNPVALVGERPLIRMTWRIAEGAQEIRGPGVEEIVRLARELVAKVAALGGSRSMGSVHILSGQNPSSSRLTIQSQWPIDKEK